MLYNNSKFDDAAAEARRRANAAGSNCKPDSFRQRLLKVCGPAVRIDDGTIIIDEKLFRQELDCMFPEQATETLPVSEDYLPPYTQLPHDPINFGSKEGARLVLNVTEIIRGRHPDADFRLRERLKKGHLHGSRI